MIGTRIQQRRESLRLTQEELADLVGTTQRQISRYERGSNNPGPELIVKLAQVLGTTTDYLLGITDEPNQFGTLDVVELELLELLRSQNPSQREKIVKAIKALV